MSEQLIERISGLFSAQCAHDEAHNCIIIWSSGAEEQLEAFISESAAPWGVLMAERQDAVERKWESDRRCMLGFAQILQENNIMPSSTELIEAYNRFFGVK